MLPASGCDLGDFGRHCGVGATADTFGRRQLEATTSKQGTGQIRLLVPGVRLCFRNRKSSRFDEVATNNETNKNGSKVMSKSSNMEPKSNNESLTHQSNKKKNEQQND